MLVHSRNAMDVGVSDVLECIDVVARKATSVAHANSLTTVLMFRRQKQQPTFFISIKSGFFSLGIQFLPYYV